MARPQADGSIIASLTAPYPADAIVFHPLDPHVFLVGTYLLDEATRRRHGKICVYRLKSLEHNLDPETNAKLIYAVDCDAVLDMKWYESMLYVGHSTGSLSIYRYNDFDSTDLLSLVTHETVLQADVLIMSLSLSSKGVLTSHSDGSASIWTHAFRPICSWTVSELEVWIQAWGKDEGIVFTGSDDGILQCWDIRARADGEVLQTLQNRKSHGAGVTAILPYGHDYELITGSYDDKIRKFDIRKLGRPFEEANLGGGVWRIIPKENHELAVCCMYDGAKVVRDTDFEVVKTWTKHESMVYGGDVSSGIVGTCSFYDKRVCIWR